MCSFSISPWAKWVFCFSIIASASFGQSPVNYSRSAPFVEGLQFTPVKIDSETPRWAQLLYADNPNMYAVEKLYRSWRKDNPVVKNGHTRNFKHYYNYLTANDGIMADGFIQPDLEEIKYREKRQWERRRKRILLEQAEVVRGRSTGNTDWESLGPFMMYRNGEASNIHANIYAIAQSPSHPDVVYAGSEAGATIFKSTDRGDNWFSPNDDISFSGYRELEVHPTDPETVYLGSQHDINKTTDGGLTWNSIYYNWNNASSAILIDPVNPNIILASGSERILRSTDGGNSWSEVWTGRCYDLKFKPGDSQTVYALMNNATTLQTDFYKSTNNGQSWTPVTSGWPNETSNGNYGGRMTCSEGTPGLIYAFIGADWTAAPSSKDGIKVMKSVDSGASWTTVLNYDNGGGVNAGQGYYDWDIEVSDNDPDIVLLGTQGRYLTTDGFATTNWALSGGSLGHADLQEALFNGTDLWVVNDGGIIKFDDETFANYEVKSLGINAVSYWSFDQGWNRDAQVGSHYHNGTSARQESYAPGEFLSYGGAEPQFSAIKHPEPDQAWSKGYGAVDGKSLPDNINDPIKSFSYNITPNAEYGSSTWRESEIEILPYAYNTHFTGVDNILWRSNDFGLAWEEVVTLGNADSKVTKIEIPRANSEVMYVAEYNSAGYSIYRSNDLGISFQELTGPGGLSDDGVYIEVDQNDEDILWLASSNGGSSNEKIYKSINGGISWTNLSTDVLDGHSIRAMLSVAGTDGGVYVISSTAVFYINNTLTDWQPLLVNLPSSPALRDIKPFYKEGKVRVAGDGRGIWSADFFDTPTTVTPQPTVNLIDQPCNRDTLQFDDFSILNHDGASWSWSFDPAPTYIDDSNKRNPKVIFGNPGSYTATMELTVNGTVYQKALDKEIVIGTGCDAVGLAGYAYDVADYWKHATISDIDKTLDAFTYSLWIRPRATQLSTATIVSKSEDNAGINFYGSTKQIAIHYPGYNTWAYETGLYAPEDRWTHLALTSDFTTGKIILYVNGESYEYTGFAAKIIAFDMVQLGWQHNWWGSRWFNGELDEFCLYDRALSQDEIRLQMHLTKSPMLDPGLLHYYQFNESSGGTTLDKVGILHAETRGDRVLSRGPIGGGSSSKSTITSNGNYDFLEEGLSMVFGSGTLPDGEVTVTRINNFPDENPTRSPAASSYWVTHNYGSNATFTALNSLTFADLDIADAPYNAGHFMLSTRESDQDGDHWTEGDLGDQIDNSTQTITFDSGLNISTFGQYAVSNLRATGWTGVISSDWDNPLNWSRNQVPTATTDVMIPADTPFLPIVNINVTIKSLSLMNGAQVEVQNGVSFMVEE